MRKLVALLVVFVLVGILATSMDASAACALV